MAPISDAVRGQLTSGDLTFLEKRLYCHEEEIDHWEIPIRASCSSSIIDGENTIPEALTEDDMKEWSDTWLQMFPTGGRPIEGLPLDTLSFYLYPTTPTEQTYDWGSKNAGRTKLNGLFVFTTFANTRDSEMDITLRDYNLNGVIDDGDELEIHTFMKGTNPTYVLTGGSWYVGETSWDGPIEDQGRFWNLVPLVESAYQSALQTHGIID